MSDTDACRGFRLTSAHWDRMALFSGAPAYPAFAVASPPAGARLTKPSSPCAVGWVWEAAPTRQVTRSTRAPMISRQRVRSLTS